MNHFHDLDESQLYDPATLATINDWNVKVSRVRTLSKKKLKAVDDIGISQDVDFITSNRRPRHDPVIVIQSVKDVDRVTDAMKPLPTSKKELTKVLDKINKIQLASDEKLVMVDSGSFCHAINAHEELPSHSIKPLTSSDNCQDAESACGGIIKRFGKVKTQGLVDGQSLDIKWDAMNVKVPILSVRKLVRDNHNVKFSRQGGYILNLHTRARIPFFEHQGVYYLKMKFLPPPSDLCNSTVISNEPVFSRPVP